MIFKWPFFGWRVWNRFFRREILSDCFEWWTYDECGEDLELNWKSFQKAKNILFVEDCYYHYRIRNTSMSKTWTLRKTMPLIERMMKIRSSICHESTKEVVNNAVTEQCLEMILQSSVSLSDEYDITERCISIIRGVAEQEGRNLTKRESAYISILDENKKNLPEIKRKLESVYSVCSNIKNADSY